MTSKSLPLVTTPILGQTPSVRGLIGIFGGTFDPVHLGHLSALDQLCDQLDFCRVHWVLSARPPHKNSISASIEQRFEMLQAALSEYSTYLADDCEIDRNGKSYMFDTVQHFRQQYPAHALCLIIGSDSLQELHTWHRFHTLIEQVQLVVLARPGYQLELPETMCERSLESLAKTSNNADVGVALFAQTDYDISSTKIRTLIANQWRNRATQTSQAKLKQWLPSSVIDYIHKQRIYKP